MTIMKPVLFSKSGEMVNGKYPGFDVQGETSRGAIEAMKKILQDSIQGCDQMLANCDEAGDWHFPSKKAS